MLFGNRKILYCSQTEVVDWLKNDKVESQTTLIPDEDAFYLLFGIDTEKQEELEKRNSHESESEDEVIQRYVNDQGYGINLKLETGHLELTPLISLENEPGLESYKFGIGDLPKMPLTRTD